MVRNLAGAESRDLSRASEVRLARETPETAPSASDKYANREGNG
jgi:hypothetical protein